MIETLTKGDVEWPVESGDEAIKKVSATNIGIFGFISFILYKLFGKKRSTEEREDKADEGGSAEVDELINSIEWDLPNY